MTFFRYTLRSSQTELHMIVHGVGKSTRILQLTKNFEKEKSNTFERKKCRSIQTFTLIVSYFFKQMC